MYTGYAKNKENTGAYHYESSCAIRLKDVVDHVADGVAIREVDHRNIDLEFLEHLALELGKRYRICA
jgi:hypothetical protein